MERRDLLIVWLAPLGFLLLVVLAFYRSDNFRYYLPLAHLGSAQPAAKGSWDSQSSMLVSDGEFQTLRKALKDKDWKNRYKAVLALTSMKKAPDLGLLLRALKDTDPTVRTNAAWSLGELKNRRALEPLIQALKDPYPSVRLEAARSLGNLQDSQALGPLVQAMEDENWHVRHEAALALLALDDHRALDFLVRILAEEDHKLHAEVEEHLDQLAEESDPDSSGGPANNGEERRETGNGETADATPEDPLLTRLIEDLQDPDWQVRNLAVQALGDRKARSAVDGLIDRLMDENEHLIVRSNAAIALGEIGDRLAVEALIYALYDHPEIRNKAIIALARIGDPRATAPLIGLLLENPEDYARSQAAWALGILRDAQAFDALITALFEDAAPTVQMEAAWALGELSDRRAIPYLRAALEGPLTDPVRDRVLSALRKLINLDNDGSEATPSDDQDKK